MCKCVINTLSTLLLTITMGFFTLGCQDQEGADQGGAQPEQPGPSQQPGQWPPDVEQPGQTDEPVAPEKQPGDLPSP